MIKDLQKANAYNLKQRGKLWTQQDIPWGHHDAGSNKFSVHVSVFQGSRGLKIDGMLGPKTLKAIQDKAEPVEVAPGFLMGGKVKDLPEFITDLEVMLEVGERFEARKRTKKPTHIVIHESVTKSRSRTVDVLKAKGYGVHFIIDGDGSISQHCDPLKESPIHANQLNSSSVGIEIVNPYYPHLISEPWIVTEPAQWWCHVLKGKLSEYVAPTEAQTKSCRALIEWLCGEISTIPLAFPTRELGPRKGRIKGWKTKEKPEPGIVAHRDFSSHADGRGMLERCFDLETED